MVTDVMSYKGGILQQKNNCRSCLITMYLCIIIFKELSHIISFQFNNKPRNLSKTDVTSLYNLLRVTSSNSRAGTRNSTSCLEVQRSFFCSDSRTSPYDLGQVTWHFFVIVSSPVKQGEYLQYLAKVT